MVKKILTVLIILAILHLPIAFTILTPVNAQILERNYTRIFTVRDDHLEINESKEIRITEYGYEIPAGTEDVFTIFFPVEGDPLEQEKINQTIESISVTDQNGSPLEYNVEETESKNLLIKVPLPSTVNVFNPTTLNLSYKSFGLLIKSGNVKDIYVPGFPEDYQLTSEKSIENITTQLIIPSGENPINFILPEAEVATTETGSKQIDIPIDLLMGQTLWTQIGTSQYYTFEISQIIEKSSEISFLFNTYKTVLPRDIQTGNISQTVFYEKITPEPFAIEQDKDKNIIAIFKVPTNKSEIIEIKGYASISINTTFFDSNSGNLTELSQEFIDEYTGEAEFWEVNSEEIQKKALELKGEKTNISEITQTTFDFIVNQIDYSYVKKYGINERQGALETLRGGAAVCMEYSDLFIALMRAQGVPARAAYGYGFDNLDYESRADNNINHQWAEVYYPAQDKWVPVDTTWGDFGTNIIGGDLSHFYSHVSSVNPSDPSLSEISYFGNSTELEERAMEINVTDKMPDVDAMTTDELIQKYEFNDSNDRYIKTFKLFANNIDSQFKDALAKYSNENIARMISFGIYGTLLLILPILLLMKLAKTSMPTKK